MEDHEFTDTEIDRAIEAIDRMLKEVAASRVRPNIEDWFCPLCGAGVVLDVTPDGTAALLGCAEKLHVEKGIALPTAYTWHKEFIDPSGWLS
ncbi:MAG: hypothetical protein H6840_12020 [Planctomycetes bacterium]|nr:hypothetical protein [Planctomycetota bacterium]